MAAKVTTPWGGASVIEEVTIRQAAADRDFASLIQLLEADSGELLVRFAYSTGGTARRGPVTLRAADLQELRTGLGDAPRLARALGMRAPG